MRTVILGILFVSYSLVLGQDLSTKKLSLFSQGLNAPLQHSNIVPLTPGERLGKNIFYDASLSRPEGYSCATCHVPETGFASPSSHDDSLAGELPGVIPDRIVARKPQRVSYAAYSPPGPVFLASLSGYLGGEFWDGRAPDNATQAKLPLLNPNEMNNEPVGPYPPLSGGYSPLVVEKVRDGAYADLFKKVFGQDVFRTASKADLYGFVTQAISYYEASAEVNPFSSKWDASRFGTPARHEYVLDSREERGRKLFFGKAQCSQCHSSAGLPLVSDVTQGKETFTMYCYANIGVPVNPANPYYNLTNCDTDPFACNPAGSNFVDYGLGGNPNPAPDGSLFMTEVPGDILDFRGLFKAPSLRNADLRPYPGFVKAYMHNGVFKSLAEVVHFYNKRNIATNAAGIEMEFTLGEILPEGYTAEFPLPEVMDNVQNASGFTPTQAASLNPPPDAVLVPGTTPVRKKSAATSSHPVPDDDGDSLGVALNGQVGNLQLSTNEEADLVRFLQILSDGYTAPRGVPPLQPVLAAAAMPANSDFFVAQLTGQPGQSYVVQTSSDLSRWVAQSTNILINASLNFTNVIDRNFKQGFWRVIPLGSAL